MVRYLLLVALALGALVITPAIARAEPTLPDDFSLVTVASGLSDPTALAYGPDGRLFITEKSGRVRVVNPGGQLAAAPVVDISDHVADAGDRGLLGIAVDPEFELNGYVYLLYTYDGDAAQPLAAKTSRLTRISVTPGNTVAAPEHVLLGSIGQAPCPAPANTVDCIPSNSDSHSIGTVRADPDGTLWVGSGDGAEYATMDPTALRALDEQSMSGKLLHVDRSGRGLPGHPFCPGEPNLDLVCTKLHAKGFRNPFRFQLRPGRTPVVGDVGWYLFEELDFAEPGRSYGWPCYEGPDPTIEYRDLEACEAEYARRPPPHAPPAHSYGHPYPVGGAVEAGPQYTATRYPQEYRNAWFFADYVQGWIRYYDLVDGQVANVRTLASEGYHGTDLELTPEGDLVYVNFGDGSSDSGTVERIVYGNAPPPAVAHASPSSGRSPLTVELSADESIDPDGDAVTYEWDFDGDGATDAEGRTASHVYATSGAHTATLTVRDARGLASADEVAVGVDVTPPVAAIAAPADGSSFRHGTPVALRGSAQDAEDGELTGGALRWRIVLHHGSHIHLVSTGLPGEQQDFVPPGDHDADSFYEIELTATDSSGLKDTERVVIRPATIALTLASSPPGAPLSYSGREYVAPASLTSAIGYRTSVSAPETLTRGGVRYRFDSWSEGGDRSRELVIPAADLTLTARYRVDASGSAVGLLGSPVGGLPAVAPRPRLRLDRPSRRTRVLGGRVTGVAARPRVLVALRTARSQGRCRRWSADHGRFGRPTRRCGSHAWMSAAVTAAGTAAWRWRAPLRGMPRRGRYVVTTRVTDGQGRTLLGASSVPLRLR